MLDEGHDASISEMAEAEKLDRRYMDRLQQLTLLAPDLVEAVLDGQVLSSASLSTLLGSFPSTWAELRGRSNTAA
jgi:hypothetical protein